MTQKPHIYWLGGSPDDPNSVYTTDKRDYAKLATKTSETRDIFRMMGLQSGMLASTHELRDVPVPPVMKLYGLTREGCTAIYKTDKTNSLSCEFDYKTHTCKIDPAVKAGMWVSTDRLLHQEDIDNIKEIDKLVMIGPTVENPNAKTFDPSKETPVDPVVPSVPDDDPEWFKIWVKYTIIGMAIFLSILFLIVMGYLIFGNSESKWSSKYETLKLSNNTLSRDYRANYDFEFE